MTLIALIVVPATLATTILLQTGFEQKIRRKERRLEKTTGRQEVQCSVARRVQLGTIQASLSTPPGAGANAPKGY